MEVNKKIVEIKTKKPPRFLPFKFVDPVDAAENEKRLIPLLLPGLKKGTVGVLAGEGGIGKSTLLIGIAFGLAHKELDVLKLSLSDGPCKILILSGEDDADVVNNKLHDFSATHGLDNRKLKLAKDGVFIATEKNLMEKINDEDWIANLKLTIEELKIDLVVFDTYSIFGGVENENDNVEAARVIEVLNKNLIAETDLCVLLVHHTNAEGNIRGAKALRDNTRVTYVIRRPNDDEKEIIEAAGFNSETLANFEIIKSNYARKGSLCWLEMTHSGVFKIADEKISVSLSQKKSEKIKTGRIGARNDQKF